MLKHGISQRATNPSEIWNKMAAYVRYIISVSCKLTAAWFQAPSEMDLVRWYFTFFCQINVVVDSIVFIGVVLTIYFKYLLNYKIFILNHVYFI